MTVPTSLRRWFVVHFAIDILFALPLFFVPEQMLGMLGWEIVDPVASRIVAAALIGIGTESLIVRQASVDVFRAMLNLKLWWSLSAVAGLVWSAVAGGPIMCWALAAVFAGFAMVWGTYWRALGRSAAA